jgi:hypothetical protein
VVEREQFLSPAISNVSYSLKSPRSPDAAH